MDICFNCEKSGDQVRLFSAISGEGIVRVCEKCLQEQNFPIIRRPTTDQLKEIERKPEMYKKMKRNFGGHSNINLDLMKQETSLRQIVDKNVKMDLPTESKPRPDLVDNFHWIIRRARKMKKVTSKQVAREIGESEAAIEMAEKGILPEDDNKLIRKLENYLGIHLVKDAPKKLKANFNSEEIGKKMELKKGKSGNLEFDANTAQSLTIADLKEMKEQKEMEIFNGPFKEDFVLNRKAENNENNPEFVKKKEKDISQRDIDNILFGRK